MTLRERLFPVEEVNEARIKKDLKILEDEDVPGLDIVIKSLIDISNSGLHDESRRAFNSLKSKFYMWRKNIINEIPENSACFLAHENLDTITYLDFMHRKSVNIDFISFNFMYEFITIRYYMTIKRELNNSDIQNIYLSGLDERLIFGLDKFDKISNWPQPTPEFFQKLKKSRWENRNTKKFADILRRLKVNLTITSFALPKYAHFTAIEKQFIELIASCNAVKKNRNYINKEDIIIGFKTYLKLLNTDVTKYKARNIPDIRDHVGEGYLVCDKCHEYYKLQPGESPDDFTDECECGERLNYYDNTNWLNESVK